MFKLPYCNRDIFFESLAFFMKNVKKIVSKIADKNDISLIYKVECDVFPDSWSESQLLGHIENNGLIYCAFDESGLLLGYCILKSVLDEWEIYRLAVSTSCRRSGVATYLLDEFINKHPFKYDVITIFLEVRKSNPARLFYESYGFTSYGERSGYYRDGEDCVLYKFQTGL